MYPDVHKNCSIVGILWGLQQEQDRLPTLPMQETLHDGILPPLRAEGPSLLPAPRDEVEYDITLYESVCLVWIDATTPDEGERVVRDCIRCRPISWHTCWPKMPEDFLSVSDFCTLMDQLSQIHAWDFLTVRDDCGPGHWHQHLSILEEWCEAEVSTEHLSTPRVSPPHGFGTFCYVLHLYSGRRRWGDFQFFLDRMAIANEGFSIHVISVDIVIDQRWGNIADPQVRRFWLDAIRSGFVVGLDPRRPSVRNVVTSPW